LFLDAQSAHHRPYSNNPNSRNILARQIAKARKAASAHVAKRDELYALVIVGDKSAVLKTTDDGIDR
jgi:hypothetical protein